MVTDNSLLLANCQHEIVRNCVFITGAPRSGTTLAGRLIGSLKGLEYQFEPPTLYMITSMYASGSLSLETAKLLLTVYLAEDLLLESVHGRRANLRPTDDSLILNYGSWGDILDRWAQVRNRSDALERINADNLRLAIKMPNVMDAVPLLRAALPDMKLVLVIREGHAVVNSILGRGWVREDGLATDLWPYHNLDSNVPVPYWVPQNLRDRWRTMTSESRAVVMWTTHAEAGLTQCRGEDGAAHDIIVLRYEELLKNPQSMIACIASSLGADITHCTRTQLDEVRHGRSQRIDTGFRATVDADLLGWFDRVNAEWGYNPKDKA